MILGLGSGIPLARPDLGLSSSPLKARNPGPIQFPFFPFSNPLKFLCPHFFLSFPFSKPKTPNPCPLHLSSYYGTPCPPVGLSLRLSWTCLHCDRPKEGQEHKPPPSIPSSDPSYPVSKLPGSPKNPLANGYPKQQLDKKTAALELRKRCSDFNPSVVACWKDDEPVPFSFLVSVWELIEKESGQIVGGKVDAAEGKDAKAADAGEVNGKVEAEDMGEVMEVLGGEGSLSSLL